MSVDANKALIRRFYAALDRQDLDAVTSLVAPSFRLHFDANPEADLAGALGLFHMFFAAFPDVRHEVHDLVAEDDRVAVRLTVHGTQRGELKGMPVTDKAVAFGAMNLFRVADGAIAEQAATTDMLGMLRQLGTIPS